MFSPLLRHQFSTSIPQHTMQLTWICLMSLKVQTIWANSLDGNIFVERADFYELNKANVEQKLKTSIETFTFRSLRCCPGEFEFIWYLQVLVSLDGRLRETKTQPNSIFLVPYFENVILSSTSLNTIAGDFIIGFIKRCNKFNSTLGCVFFFRMIETIWEYPIWT